MGRLSAQDCQPAAPTWAAAWIGHRDGCKTRPNDESAELAKKEATDALSHNDHRGEWTTLEQIVRMDDKKALVIVEGAAEHGEAVDVLTAVRLATAAP